MRPDEAENVFNLLRKVYVRHSFLERGLPAYREALRTQEYFSIAFFQDGQIIAHGGYRLHDSFALMSLLIVDPATRGTGLGRAIFEARLEAIEQHSVSFVIGYAVTQHLRSQNLFSDDFKPIGLDIGYEDIFHGADATYNRTARSNAEIVLCRRSSDRYHRASLSLAPGYHSFAGEILASVQIDCRLKAVSDPRGYKPAVFLGFHPSGKNGMLSPDFLTSKVDFRSVLTSNDERCEFVKRIRSMYEQLGTH